ncbi:MAG TPA: DNA-binding protein, partial [Polyangiales bacterium]
LPYGYKFAVDDGSGEVLIFVNLETEIDVTRLAPGQRVKVTGFSSQFDDHYEIDPRDADDVVVYGR